MPTKRQKIIACPHCGQNVPLAVLPKGSNPGGNSAGLLSAGLWGIEGVAAYLGVSGRMVRRLYSDKGLPLIERQRPSDSRKMLWSSPVMIHTWLMAWASTDRKARLSLLGMKRRSTRPPQDPS